MERLPNEKGFTIIEAMVALLILSAGMLGVGTMLTTSLSLDRESTRERQAQYMAIDKIEYLRKLPRNTSTLVANSVIHNDELVTVSIGPPVVPDNFAEYKDYGYSAIVSSHPEEVDTYLFLDPDSSKRNLYARRWTIARVYWNDPLSGGWVDSGILQVDIWVGWPVKSGCTSDDPTKCRRFIEMTSFFRPLPAPTAP